MRVHPVERAVLGGVSDLPFQMRPARWSSASSARTRVSDSRFTTRWLRPTTSSRVYCVVSQNLSFTDVIVPRTSVVTTMECS